MTPGHVHGAERRADRRALAAALLLIASFMAAEVVFGVLAGSLALLADAGHMLTDAAALALALVASRVAERPARGRFTFGFRRVEILAAQANGVVLAVVGVSIVVAAIRRLVSPTEVRGGVVLSVAIAGVVVNVVAALLLAAPGRRSLNVRGAFLHITSDLAAFAGTAVAGALVLVTGWDRFDPLASLLVAGLVFWSSWLILRESARIFLESSPSSIDPQAVGRALVAAPGVVEVHDLHVWTVADGFPALSAHVLVERGIDCHAARRELELLLERHFGLDHTTLQVDHATGDEPLQLGEPYRRRAPV